jgi:hypothetical protein
MSRRLPVALPLALSTLRRLAWSGAAWSANRRATPMSHREPKP